MTESPSSTGRRPRWADSVSYLAACRWTRAGVLALVLVAALFSRTLRCDEGLPYLHRWGEPNIGSRSLDIVRTGDLNPHWFRYGSPTIYMHAAVDAVCYVWMCSQPAGSPDSIRSLDEIRTMADTKWQWTLSHPAFFHWNRLATALIGAGTVLLTYLLARRVSGPWTSILAAAVVAGAAIHIEVSTTIRTDMPAALLALGAVLAALAAYQSGHAGTLVLSFALAGLAASTKYNIVIALIAPFAALALATARREPLARPWLWGVGFLLPPLAFVCGSPFALFDLPTFLSDAGAEVSHYKLEGQGRRTVDPGLAHALNQLGQFRDNVSWIALALCVPGVLVLGMRRIGWLLLAFPAVYFVFMTRTTVDFHHNFVVLYPFLGISAACGAEWIHRRLAARETSGQPGQAAPFLAVVLAALAGLHVLPPTLAAWRAHGTPETRTPGREPRQPARRRARLEEGRHRERAAHAPPRPRPHRDRARGPAPRGAPRGRQLRRDRLPDRVHGPQGRRREGVEAGRPHEPHHARGWSGRIDRRRADLPGYPVGEPGCIGLRFGLILLAGLVGVGPEKPQRRRGSRKRTQRLGRLRRPNE